MSPADNVASHLVPDVLNVWFEEKYAELAMLVVREGSPAVSRTRNPSLWQWLRNLREVWRAGKLPYWQEQRLSAAGVTFGEEGRTPWPVMVNQLARFQKQHTQWDVAYIKKFDIKLALWVNRQKRLLRTEILTPAQKALLGNMSLEPAKAASRGTHAEVDEKHRATLDDLAEYAATHGHLRLPPSADQASLYRRAIILKNRARRQPGGWVCQELRRVGAFRPYEDLAWENRFAAWRRYISETGDYACEGSPPADVAAWDAEMRAKFFERPGDPLLVRDRYRLPLVPGFERAKWRGRLLDRETFREMLDAETFVGRVRGRLLAAGFVVTMPAVSENLLAAAKLGKACGLPPISGMPLRTVLRAASALTRAGRLTPAAEQSLRTHGLTWCQRTMRWRDLAQRLPGARVAQPKALVVRGSNAPIGPRAVTLADSRMMLIGSLAPKRELDRHPLETQLFQALKDVFIGGQPLSLRQLAQIPSVRHLTFRMLGGDVKNIQTALRTALWHLCLHKCLEPSIQAAEEDFLVFTAAQGSGWREFVSAED